MSNNNKINNEYIINNEDEFIVNNEDEYIVNNEDEYINVILGDMYKIYFSIWYQYSRVRQDYNYYLQTTIIIFKHTFLIGHDI